MIVVKVELWSAVTGEKTELARMVLDNIGGTRTKGYYRVRTLVGRSKEALDRALNNIPMKVNREGRVTGHERLREHVWHLIGKALASVNYGGKP